jgi:CDP-diacylglycerol--glycerol-3-phosphate 3-phosphatidyltransferase
MTNFILMLTISRIFFAILVFILILFFQNYFLSFLFFLIAAVTDYLDGSLARKYNAESRLGEILDPISDKVLLLSLLFSLSLATSDLFLASISCLILTREFIVSSLRESSALKDNNNLLKVTNIAKIKTATQFIAISFYLFSLAFDYALIFFIAHFIFFMAALLTFLSLTKYLEIFVKEGLR